MPIRRATVLRRALLAFAGATLLACDNSEEPSTPTNLTFVQTANLAGRAGEALTTPVSVRVTASNGRALPNQTVTFTVATGGGSVAPGTATTDAAGQASTVWTLGRSVGAQTLSATVGTLPPVTVTAVASAGRPATVSAQGGDNQTAAVGTTVAVRPSVLVRDAGGNPVPGVTVNFEPVGAAGTVSGATAQTDAAGVATVGSWQLGPSAGRQQLRALVLESNVTGNPVVFSATGLAGQASRIEIVAGATAEGTVGGQLATASLPSIVVRDANGNPVADVAVTFDITSALGGSLAGATTRTDAQGRDTLGGFTLPGTAGLSTIRATVQGAGTASFVVNGRAAAASRIEVQSGANQSERAGSTLRIPFGVTVRDQFGNPVAGVPVTFVATGAPAGGQASILGGTQTTGATGQAAVGGIQLGTTPGTYTFEARVGGLTAATFTATALPGAPAAVSLVSGDSLTVLAFQRAPQAFVVRVVDSTGFPVPNAVVNFAIAQGGGGTLSATSATTDAQGRASVTYTGTGVLGTTTVTASVGALTPVVFTVTTASNTPASVRAVQGNNQTATAGTQVALAPIVQVLDAFGNPVPGVTVLFNIIGGGGVQNPTAVTDAQGQATAGQWTLGGGAGTYVVSAIVSAPGSGNIVGNPVRFTATGITVPVGATIAVLSNDNQTAPVGSVLANPPVFVVRNAAGGALAGVTVQFIASGDGEVSPQFAQTDASGQVRPTRWKLSTAAGVNTLFAGVVGAGVSATAQATGQ